MDDLDTRDIAHWRMCATGLWGPTAAGPVEVVTRLLAVQAQQYRPALWSLAGRVAGRVTESQVQARVDGGAVLRTHVLRPTWHFVAPDDLPLLLAATAPRVQAALAYHYRRSGLDTASLARTDALLADLLAGGRQLTRKEIGTELVSRGVAVDGLGLANLLMHAELESVVVSGAVRGRQHTYAAFGARVSGSAVDAVPSDRASTVALVAGRFLAGRGPVTAKDLAWWASLTVKESRAGLEAVPGVCRHDVGGRVYYSLGSPPAAPPPPGRVDLVQAFDEIGIAYSESRNVLRPSWLTSGQPLIGLREHVVLLDGQVFGRCTWKVQDASRSRPSGALTVSLEALRTPTARDRRGVDEAVGRLGEFLGVPAGGSRWEEIAMT